MDVFERYANRPVVEPWPMDLDTNKQVDRIANILLTKFREDPGKPVRRESILEQTHRLLIQLQHEADYWRREWDRDHVWNTEYRAGLHRGVEESLSSVAIKVEEIVERSRWAIVFGFVSHFLTWLGLTGVLIWWDSHFK